MWYSIDKKCFLQNFSRQILAQAIELAWPYFQVIANKGVKLNLMTIPMMNLFIGAILLPAKRCDMCRVYCHFDQMGG